MRSSMVLCAVAAFRSRAEIVRQSFSGRAYKIRKITLSTSGFVPQPLEGGQSMITVSANGTIEVE